jgi:bacterioferritin (cytochrome b1)
MENISLFISYADSNEEMKNELEKHLSILKRSGKNYYMETQKC